MSTPQQKTVVITGASGLLGRAVTAKFTSQGDIVFPLAYSRAASDASFTKLDLTDRDAVNGFFETHRVDAVLHCAAERRPDVAEANPQLAAKVNVAVPSHLAELSGKYGFELIYISTDYVFDGSKPPYEVDDEPNPLQSYGEQKRGGEKAVLTEREKGAKATVLRVPILYGRTTYHGESAVNILVDVVQDQSGKKYKMDDYQIRYPTNVVDVARVMYDLIHLDKPLPAILHYTSPAKSTTKWGMTQVIAKHLGLSTDHITPDSAKPIGGTPRPHDCTFSTKSLTDIGIDPREDNEFDSWWASYAQELKA